MESIEIYPKILVYRNVFKDSQKMYDILKESAENKDDRLFSKWSPWSRFGDYLSTAVPNNFNGKFNIENINNLRAESKVEKDQKLFLLELHEGFNAVTKDYIEKFGHEFNFDQNATIKDYEGDDVSLWQVYGPSICRYHKEWDPEATWVKGMSMTYHSDYIREPISSPGYKFAITVNAYFNDDYEGGEIDFYVDNQLYKYKPKMGDWIVFPSGHPEVLTKNDEVYLHGVVQSTKEHKYFARMYWRKYNVGSSEWFEKEKRFGKEAWKSMQEEITAQYSDLLPKRYEIKGAERIQNEFNQ